MYIYIYKLVYIHKQNKNNKEQIVPVTTVMVKIQRVVDQPL